MNPVPVVQLWIGLSILFWLTSYLFPASYRRLLRGASAAFAVACGVLMFAWFYWPVADCTEVPWWFWWCQWPDFA